MLEVAEIKLQREERAGRTPGNSDHTVAQPLANIDIFIRSWMLDALLAKAFGAGWWVFSDHNWSVAIAHARAARQQCIFIRRIRIRVNRDGRNVKLAAECPFIQRLDILESMFETITTKIDLVFRHRVEHECVVRIGRVSECENVPLRRHGRTLSLR